MGDKITEIRRGKKPKKASQKFSNTQSIVKNKKWKNMGEKRETNANNIWLSDKWRQDKILIAC